MTAVARLISDKPLSQPVADPITPDPLLDFLRTVARGARCKGYVDLFGACAALSGNRTVAAQAAAEVLVRGLVHALGRRPILYRNGEREQSFDERWLMALADGLRRDHTPSVTFLLHSRVPKHAHRNLIFLLRNVVDNFCLD
ncbi:hypothetical protein [Phaeobacter sp.]|uniref:hypothetical protein n=1 Tax=Phaeobacter sp. TaxID=1902409 RepID=UPI0025F7F2D4|nr:hypothetical protein [Phaeobacter sp.]